MPWSFLLLHSIHDDKDTFLSEYEASVTAEQCAKLNWVAKLLVELYAHKIAFERMGEGQRKARD